MARPLRLEYEGAIYHITSRGNERKKIFFADRDYERFKEYVEDAKHKHGILIHSYVLMSNHYHLILETPAGNLNRVMHNINGSYTTYVNIKRKRTGHLFQGRYKAILVDRDSYLLELSRYIHLNPVRAGMVQKAEDYPYTSYGAYVSGKEDKITDQGTILEMLSGKPKEARKRYREFVESMAGEQQESPIKKAYGGFILGREKFIKEGLKRLKEGYLLREEVSHRRALKTALGIDEIVEIIAGRLIIKKNDIKENARADVRKIAIYIIKKHTGATNKQIGEYFGLSYSGVSKVNERFTEQLNGSKQLRKTIVGIERSPSNVRPLDSLHLTEKKLSGIIEKLHNNLLCVKKNERN